MEPGYTGFYTKGVFKIPISSTQEWLLEYTAGLPYAQEVGGMNPLDRAAMVREIAAKLKDLWDGDSFAVPAEVHFVYARK